MGKYSHERVRSWDGVIVKQRIINSVIDYTGPINIYFIQMERTTRLAWMCSVTGQGGGVLVRGTEFQIKYFINCLNYSTKEIFACGFRESSQHGDFTEVNFRGNCVTFELLNCYFSVNFGIREAIEHTRSIHQVNFKCQKQITNYLNELLA